MLDFRRSRGLPAFLMMLGCICVLGVASACWGGDSKSAPPGGSTEVAGETPRRSWAGKDNAPPIPGGVTWFNVERPLTLEELKGRMVLLDFWTLGCINCQHIIPDLKRLEEEFGDDLVVIGVHSGKYATEHDDESIREAIRRYGLEHPVINDPDFVVWRTFGANAWPTLVLIDPAGNLVGGHTGEGVYQLFQPILQSLKDEFGASGVLKPAPLPLSLDAAPRTSVLSYPGKALADARSGRLYVADSGNNRVIVSSLDGQLIRAVGTGREGFADGGPGEASFRQPQGLALSEDGATLYVADTRNHAVRAVDTTTFAVTTIAGTGQQLQRLPQGAAPARETALASPWDVVAAGQQLFISMAGIHQIWILDLRENTVAVFAGTSREGIDDGPRRDMATLAQPSGITTDGTDLYWVDPESSSLRFVPIAGDGDVRTLVGTGLFDYGAADGPGGRARFQHAQGVTYDDGALYIADTYNHRLRVYDLTSRQVGTTAGAERGWADGVAGMAKLDEPGGLSVANGKLYIADTNNHLVRVFDIASGQLSTLTFTNLAAIVDTTGARVAQVELPKASVSPGATNLRISLSTPDGHHLNGAAPSKLELVSANGAVVELGEQSLSWSTDEASVTIPVPVRLAEGSTTVTATLSAYYCRTGAEALCFVGMYELSLPVEVAAGSNNGELVLAYELPEGG